MRAALSFLFLIALSSTALAQGTSEDGFSSVEQAQLWISTYYENPEPGRLAPLALFLSQTPDIGEDSRKLAASFVGAALAAAPQTHEAFFSSVATTTNGRLLAVPTFWFMGDAAGRTLLERARDQWTGDEGKLAGQLLQADPPDLLGTPIASLLHLDHLWSLFYATGEERPVLAVASAMDMGTGATAQDMMLARAAAMSLSANAKRHERVRGILTEAAKKASGEQKQRLLDVLER